MWISACPLIRSNEVAEAYIRELDEGSDGYANGIITARPEGWELRVNAFTPRVRLRKALSAWPVDFKAKPRKWIDDHISQARWWIMNFHYTACQMNCQ